MTISFPARVYLGQIQPAAKEIAIALDRSLQWLEKPLKSGDHIFLKPNLTYPVYAPGVCTSPTFMEGIMILFAEYGIHSTWVEGDGGNGTYTADEAFHGHGFDEFKQKYGVRTLNVTQNEWVNQKMEVAGNKFELPFPKIFVDRPFDRFISVPVFKTHVYTSVSLGYKNLWGLIPDPLRIYYHYVLDRGIIGLVKQTHPDIVLIDGLISLDGEGPINGFSVETNRFLASTDAGAAEIIGCKMMGVDPLSLRYLKYAKQEGLLPEEDEIITSRPMNEFAIHRFHMRRSIWNVASIQMSRFPWLQKLVYHSSFSPVIYFLMNSLRGRNQRQALMRTGFWRNHS